MVASTIKASSNASIFQAKDEYAGYTIDCSANPYDLRPAADLIIEAAGRMRAELPPGTPLVILMGEKHTCSAHIELQHMVAAKMQAQGQRFCMGYELSANTLAQVITTNMPELGPLDVEDILDLDVDGVGGLLSHMTRCVEASDAPAAQTNLMAFCYENKIPCIFNDAARDFNNQGDGYLDMHNPFNVAAAQACHITKKSGIHIYGPGGIGVRNQNMAVRGIAFAASYGMDTIVQNTGRAHVLGQKYGGFDAPVQSLMQAYQAVGAAVLPVFITTSGHDGGVHTIPDQRLPHLKNGVLIQGLADDEFRAESHDDGAERAFIIEKLHGNSGQLTRFFDTERDMGRHIDSIRDHCDRIVKQHHESRLHHKASLCA